MQEQLYKSQDFYLSAVCLSAGLSLIRLDKNGERYVTFVFSDPQNQASQIIANHWNRTLMVYSRDLIEAINEIKTRLHSIA